MTTFILVHGAWHGSWCWQKLVPLLEAQGHTVLAPDLPGHELPDGAPATTTLEDYGRAIAGLADAQPQQVVLVGHSMGGGVITQAAAYSSSIAGLIYLAAFVPSHGESIAELAGSAEVDELSPQMDTAPDGERMVVKPGGGSIVFYADCTADEQAWANAKLVPQPFRPITEPLEDPQGRAAALPSAGIICTQDKAIDPNLQRMMCDERGMITFEMDTGHSPFLSAPDDLAGLITKAASELESRS